MNPRPVLFLALVLTLAATAAAADKAKSDLLPPDKRRVAVELGQQLTRPPEPEPLPADLAQPFNPPGFDLPDRGETPPNPAPGVAGGRDVDPNSPARSAPAPAERERLETLAGKIPATGTISLRGERLLSFGSKNVRIGSHFTITYNGQDYDLVLVSVDSTTFTVRLGNEEVTRPIKPGK